MPEQSDFSVWRYIYARERTEAATGYISCEPDIEESFERSLARLASRPLDSFLHQKLLNALGAMDSSAWRALSRRCLNTSSLPLLENADREALQGVLACLLLECALVIANCRLAIKDEIPSLHKAAGDWTRYTPFHHIMKLWESGRAGDFELYGRAIRELVEIPSSKPALLDEALNEKLFGKLAAFAKYEKLLPKLYADFIPAKGGLERVPAQELAARALERLERAGLLYGPEMRHEASLSPIALLRQWIVRTEVRQGRHRHIMEGLSTAYGRGLSLAQARVSCLMEIVERASAHASIKPGGSYGAGEIQGRLRELPLLYGSAGKMRAAGHRLFIPAQGDSALWEDVPLFWVEGRDARGEKLIVPAQAVFLFSNLDEASLYEQGASTGLASGNTLAEAKLAALTEILERDANATSMHHYRHCFIPRSRDTMIQGLLDDYRGKRIFIYMQDISNECGFPAFRCIVRDGRGAAFYATGASLDGKKAALSALTETPWPYSWSSTFPSSRISAPVQHNLPVRYLEELPNYSFGNAEADLLLLENLMLAQGLAPVYVDISREDLQFPVIRAFIPDMESNGEYDAAMPPGPRFRARAYLYGKNYFQQ